MNKNELKKILKPLIKDCIKEVIFEDGTLSGIISEVIQGTAGLSTISENKPQNKFMKEQSEANREKKRKKLLENRKKMLDAIGKDSYNGVDLFEGTTPAPAATSNGQGPLSGVDPNDSGVDISSFMGGSQLWKKVIGN